MVTLAGMNSGNATPPLGNDNHNRQTGTSIGSSHLQEHYEIFPTLANLNVYSPSANAQLPPWARELNRTRDSRASSVISTRTRVSATTLQEDTRSIDINVGGHSFRISRDGSQISEGPPPPYPGPGSEPINEESTSHRPMATVKLSYISSTPNELSIAVGQVVEVVRKEANGWWLCKNLENDTQGWTPGAYLEEMYQASTEPPAPISAPPGADAALGNVASQSDSRAAETPVVPSIGPQPLGAFLRQNALGSRFMEWDSFSGRGPPKPASANILDPGEVDMPSPVQGWEEPNSSRGAVRSTSSSDPLLDIHTPDRVPSYKAGKDTISVDPGSIHRRSVSANNLPFNNTPTTSATSPLQRRNGVRLPALVTTDAWQSNRIPHKKSLAPSKGGSRSVETQSAGPILMTDDQEQDTRSPTFIGKGATGLFPASFPAVQDVKAEHVNTTSGVEPVRQPSSPLRSSSPDTVIDAADESHTAPLPMDDENDVSLHYTRMIRCLDRDHRKVLHERDIELAGYRSRLHEMDTVYRQELKAKDFVLDDLKKRLSHLEEAIEEKLEKARNQVEDVWEGRWRERNQLLMERIRRVEDDHKKHLEKVAAQSPS